MAASVAVALLVAFLTPVVVVYLFTSSRRRPNKNPLPGNLPPGSLGLPMMGQSLGLLRAMRSNTAERWLQDRVDRYGPVSKLSLFGSPTVFVTGAAANKLVFRSDALAPKQPRCLPLILGRRNILELILGRRNILGRTCCGGTSAPSTPRWRGTWTRGGRGAADEAAHVRHHRVARRRPRQLPRQPARRGRRRRRRRRAAADGRGERGQRHAHPRRRPRHVVRAHDLHDPSPRGRSCNPRRHGSRGRARRDRQEQGRRRGADMGGPERHEVHMARGAGDDADDPTHLRQLPASAGGHRVRRLLHPQGVAGVLGVQRDAHGPQHLPGAGKVPAVAVREPGAALLVRGVRWRAEAVRRDRVRQGGDAGDLLRRFRWRLCCEDKGNTFVRDPMPSPLNGLRIELESRDMASPTPTASKSAC